MSTRPRRDLTTLEYIVLGLLSLRPQSGYSIMNFFEGDAYGWTASPGTIYPILKRLEKQAIIEGELEVEYETRPRKVYKLAALGAELLDDWLREVPRAAPMAEQRELAKWKFQFMEGRLQKADILQWLQNYLDTLRIYDYGQRVFQEGTLKAMNELGQTSVHRQLLMESTLMENNTLRTWLELAKARIAATVTTEMRAVPFADPPAHEPRKPRSRFSGDDQPAEELDEPGDFG
ncbi:MAG: PadR family transcriptional regulator [bacterium]|nr:PadR family transcriptional regulator [bacterium]